MELEQLIREIKEYSGATYPIDFDAIESIHYLVKMAYLNGVAKGLQQAQDNFARTLETVFKTKPECKHEQVEATPLGGYRCVFCDKWLSHSEVDQ